MQRPREGTIRTRGGDPWVHSISRALAGHDGAALGQEPPITGAGMNQREQEEIFSAARKARKV